MRERARPVTGPVTGPPNLNLPHTHLFLLPLVWMSTRAALRIWTMASFLVFAWAAWRSLRALNWRLPLLGWLTLAVYLLAWGPAAAFSLTAQVSLLLMGPVTAAWLAARSGRSARAGGWLGLAAAIKPFLFLFVPYFLIRRDWGALRALAITTALMVGIGLAVFGADAYREWMIATAQGVVGRPLLERVDILGHGTPLRAVRLWAGRAAICHCGALGNRGLCARRRDVPWTHSPNAEQQCCDRP